MDDTKRLDKELDNVLEPLLRKHGWVPPDCKVAVQGISVTGTKMTIHAVMIDIPIAISKELNTASGSFSVKQWAHLESDHQGHEVIENHAGGKAFKYCRNCRVEVA